MRRRPQERAARKLAAPDAGKDVEALGRAGDRRGDEPAWLAWGTVAHTIL